MPPTEVQFEGAAGVASADLRSWRCEDCKRYFGHRCMVAYLNKDNTFAYKDSKTFRDAIEEAKTSTPVPWSNQSKQMERTDRLVCAHCCGTYTTRTTSRMAR